MTCTLKVRTGTESLAPKYYKASQCEYLSGGKRPPKAPDPYDDFSGMNPNPISRIPAQPEEDAPAEEAQTETQE